MAEAAGRLQAREGHACTSVCTCVRVLASSPQTPGSRRERGGAATAAGKQEEQRENGGQESLNVHNHKKCSQMHADGIYLSSPLYPIIPAKSTSSCDGKHSEGLTFCEPPPETSVKTVMRVPDREVHDGDRDLEAV